MSPLDKESVPANLRRGGQPTSEADKGMFHVPPTSAAIDGGFPGCSAPLAAIRVPPGTGRSPPEAKREDRPDVDTGVPVRSMLWRQAAVRLELSRVRRDWRCARIDSAPPTSGVHLKGVMLMNKLTGPLIAVVVSAASLIPFAAMAAQKDDAQIRSLEARFAKAVAAKDIDAVMKVYSPHVFVFDVVPPRQYVGAAAYREDWKAV
ncbi:MAG: hypothetical protein M3T55_08750, partial [Pseudomonadota bacterium]|nr:hypothetical protein [Pseudomonadota bacterium]